MKKSELNKLLAKAEKLFDMIVKQCATKDGNIDIEEISLIVDRIKFLKDRTLMMLDSERLTEKKIKELLKVLSFDDAEADYIA